MELYPCKSNLVKTMQVRKIIDIAIKTNSNTAKRIAGKAIQHKHVSTPDIQLVQNKVHSNLFDITLPNGEKAGSINWNIGPDEVMQSFYQKGTLPNSWIYNGKIKKFIEILQINLLNAKGQGLGRKTIQKIYELSKKLDYGGRIHLEALEEAKGFYSKLGFDIPPVLKAKFDNIYAQCLQQAKRLKLNQSEFLSLLKKQGVPEIVNGKYNLGGSRFFEPTIENLQSLFKN